MVHDRKEPQAKGVQSTRFIGRLSFAALTCRQWQTSEAQLSHRSRKGAEVSRRRFAFLQGDDEGAD